MADRSGVPEGVRPDRQAVVRDYEREPVPEHVRKNWLQMGMVWIGVGLCIPAFMLGGAVGAGLTLGQAFAAIFLGSLVLTVVSSLVSVIGARTNLSAAMLSRFAFGERGSYLVALVMALGSFGWFGVQTGVFGEAALALLGLLGASAPKVLLILLGGILMTSTAVFGYRAIEKLSIIAVPALAALMFASLYRVLAEHPWGHLAASPPPGDPLPFGVAVSIVAGSFMVGAVISPDICRYARREADAVGSCITGFSVGFVIIVFIGSILAQATGQADIVQVMAGLGWGAIAFIVLILSQWSTNDNNLYSAALAFSVVFRTWPKWRLTVAAGLLGTLLAMLGIYGQFVPWLMVLSALVPPIGGVVAADYYLVSRERYRFEQLASLPAVRWPAFAAWALGSLTAFATTPPPTGWGWFQLTTVSAIDAFLVAVAAHTVLARALERRAAAAPAAGD